MLRKFLLQLKARHLQALREQKGQSIIIFTFAFIGLIAMLGLALDLGLVYIEKVKVNRTADAATLAAVVELPYEQDTINRAIEYIQLNGYDVGVDTEILVRGCVVSDTSYVDALGVTHVYDVPPAGGTDTPQNVGEPGFTNPMTRTTLITGAAYISATQQPPRATFVIDTGGYQSHNNDTDDAEECAGNNLGTATKLRVAGRVNVNMSFMQFFGFRSVPVEDTSTAENLTSLDVIVVFDISGSMEDQTICTDCWVRTSYNPDWPNNGYFNPLPYWEQWKNSASGGAAATGNQSIPNSDLCTLALPKPFITNTYKYLTLEAELYSAVGGGDWGLDVRTPGNGFWSIQRGSEGSTGMAPEASDMKNSAGQPAYQSSNVCRPNVEGGQIDCTVGNSNGGNGDNVCSSADGGQAIDCSAFIAARPMANYGQMPGNIPNLNGASYNSNCFINSGGTGSTGGDCWSNNPFNTIPGLERGPSTVPFVEYDFTPTWTQTTSIWLRVIGGGLEAFTWAGSSPDQILPDVNGGGTGNNITPWRKVIYWQVNNGTIFERKDNVNNDYSNSPDENNTNDTEHVQNFNRWNANRANSGAWRWIKLGSTTTVSGTPATFRLYQGSAGYMVDKIVFTNDPNGNTPEGGDKITNAANIPAALRRTVTGTVWTTGFNSNPPDNAWRESIGPPASPGSATREACNKCNPAYGYTVTSADCTCKKNGGEAGYGTGSGCTFVSTVTPTNQLQTEVLYGLYSGNQPMRSAQEAVKRFARKLDPKFDQLGIVAFTTNTSNASDRRAKLQCLTWATTQLGNPARCYDSSLGTPLTYTNVFSAVEKQWPSDSTNIAMGVREGLEELGISTPDNPDTVNSGTCTAAADDGNACDRRGAARRVIILMTDGSPNVNTNSSSVPSSDRSLCAPGGGRPDLWDGLLGTEDADFECAMYYAFLASQANVTLYTIGIGGGANRDLLTAMATGTDPRSGGEPFTHFVSKGGQYFPAAKPSDLDLIFDQILSNIFVRIVS
ncbi:MAG: TadE/TadG family protein [Anaerolineae bacterium]|nr:TadE/TadG family protein [Anaerolineae bacterium]